MEEGSAPAEGYFVELLEGQGPCGGVIGRDGPTRVIRPDTAYYLLTEGHGGRCRAARDQFAFRSFQVKAGNASQADRKDWLGSGAVSEIPAFWEDRWEDRGESHRSRRNGVMTGPPRVQLT